jgi:hypothetical protein
MVEKSQHRPHLHHHHYPFTHQNSHAPRQTLPSHVFTQTDSSFLCVDSDRQFYFLFGSLTSSQDEAGAHSGQRDMTLSAVLVSTILSVTLQSDTVPLLVSTAENS